MRLLLALMTLTLCFDAQASTFITATIAVTNSAGTTNGNTLTVNASTRTWTNTVTAPATQILAATNQALAASALLNHAAIHPFSGLTLGHTSTTNITLRSAADTGLVVSLSAGWGTVSLATNTGGSGTVVTLPLTADAVTAVQVAVNQMTFTNLVAHDTGTNYWLDFAAPEYLLTATTNVHLSVSTNWPSTNATRVTGIRFKGAATDYGLTWNTNWILLGITNASLVIPSNKVARAAFMINGLGETNVIWGWSVQQQ